MRWTAQCKGWVLVTCGRHRTCMCSVLQGNGECPTPLQGHISGLFGRVKGPSQLRSSPCSQEELSTGERLSRLELSMEQLQQHMVAGFQVRSIVDVLRGAHMRDFQVHINWCHP
jgi:hypothetical protein